ncbi:hypothetical protein [Pedobacter faecalis]|uniref:hypothetical protein n=1 Tax=Pedobacter faecalis TaxID=3041495 RepID=UPI0025514CFF|nr:hypothetical protein [Pedobacter sp. ELA7]
MEKDLNPYEFTIDIDGEPHAIRVEVPQEGDYIVYINGERSGHLYTVQGDTKLEWRTDDEISQRLVDEIGADILLLENNLP